ncbi:hypothetical protein GCM10027293_33370 [Pontibacter aydingkolensis]
MPVAVEPETYEQGLASIPVEEQLMQAKSVMIRNALHLSKDQLKDLLLVYMQFDAEINRLNGKTTKFDANQPENFCTEELDKMIRTQLDNVVKISSIKFKYYPKFRTEL